MIQFPIDPTPFVIPYVILIFLLPWGLAASFLIRELALAQREGQLSRLMGFTGLSIIERIKAAREYRGSNPLAMRLHQKTVQWALITILLWIVGFVLLGSTLFIMDRNDLLINHSRGLYGPHEIRQTP